MQRNPEPHPPRPFAPPQHRRIIAPDLRAARALGSRSVELLEDQGGDGVDAVVDAHGEHEDEEGVFFGRVEAELGRGAEEEGADVHRCACGVRGDEFGV